MRTPRQELVRQLQDLSLVEMKPTAEWGLTRGGRDFLDQLDLMRELDDRPDTAAGRRPQAEAVAPRGKRPGDDVQPKRRGRRKVTR